MGKKKRKRRRKEPQRTNEELVALIQQGDDYYMGALLEQNEAYIRWNMGKLKIRDVFNEDDIEAPIWCHPACEKWKDSTTAFAIEVTGEDHNGLVGNVYLIDYDESVRFVKDHTGPPARAAETAGVFIEAIRAKAHYTSKAAWKKTLSEIYQHN